MPPSADASKAHTLYMADLAGEVLMFLIQTFPLDFSSLQSLLCLSKSFRQSLNCNTLMWLALANRASKCCQACFLEARASASAVRSCLPGAQYWRNTTKVLVAAGALRRQWGIRAAHRTFVNVGKHKMID